MIEAGTIFSTADLKHRMAESGLRTPSTNELGAMLRTLRREGYVEVDSKEHNGFAYRHGWRYQHGEE